MRVTAVWILLVCGCAGGGGAPAPVLLIGAAGDTHVYNMAPGEDPLAGVADELAELDILLFNYEGVLTSDPAATACAARPGQSLFASRPEVAAFLARAPTTVATLANNHTLDCAAAGLEETALELAARGIETVGAPLHVETNGVRVAVAAYLAMANAPAGVPRWDAAAIAEVAALAAQADFVIVALHLHLAAGWTDRAAQGHVDAVRRALDAGADLVVAHGPHMPQGVLRHGSGVGLMSLGNFLFRPDYTMPDQAHDTVLARVAVFANRVSVSLLPLRLDAAGRPQRPAAAEAQRILAGLAARSAELGAHLDLRGGVAVLN